MGRHYSLVLSSEKGLERQLISTSEMEKSRRLQWPANLTDFKIISEYALDRLPHLSEEIIFPTGYLSIPGGARKFIQEPFQTGIETGIDWQPLKKYMQKCFYNYIGTALQKKKISI